MNLLVQPIEILRAPLAANSAASVDRPARARQAGEIARSTGERVENSLWDALDILLLSLPDLLRFASALAVGWLIGWLLARAIAARLRRRGRADLARLLGTIVIGLSVLVVGLFALTILFPSIAPKDILSVLGIGSLAIGFAFKDMLQNLLAGAILLWREPYRTGDEIIVGRGEFEGVVEEVETRATHIRTIDQRLVIIPNMTIFSNAITVNTQSDYRMTRVIVSIAYGGDPRPALAVVLDAVKRVEGVRQEPAPQATLDALSDYSIDLVVLYAAPSATVEQIRTKGAVLLAIHDACRDHDIGMPYPTQVNLVHRHGEDGGPDKLAGPLSGDRRG